MKKYLAIFLLFTIFILSGCSAAEDIGYEECDAGYVLVDGYCEDIEPHYISFDSVLTYDVRSYSFIDTSSEDILYNTFSLEEDYILVSASVLSIEFNTFEETEYTEVLDSVSELAVYSDSSIESVVKLETKEFALLAEDANVTLTAQNLFTVNSLRIKQTDLIAQTNGFYTISKQSYLEKRLNIQLTSENITNFELLQYLFSDLHNQYGEILYIKDNTFEEFLVKLEEYYTPEEILTYSDLVNEYNLLKQLQ